MDIKRRPIELHQLINKGYFTQCRDRIYILDINCCDAFDRTPLILCCFIEDNSWSLSLTQQLLEVGADLRKQDYSRRNILHYCSLTENYELFKLILQSLDCNINAVDCYGNTPLLYAIASNNQEIIKLVLDYYEKFKVDIDKVNYRGINAFMQACICENAELVEILLKFQPDLTIKDVNNKTALKYREDFNKKSEFMQKVATNRRMSRSVRFDDLEIIRQIKEESNNLLKASTENQESHHQVDTKNDQNINLVKEFQFKLKKIKHNKVDFSYTGRIERPKTTLGRTDKRSQSLSRPKTASESSRKTQISGNWYNILGPLYVNLEQKCSPAYRDFYKIEQDNPRSRKNSTTQNSDKSRVKPRRTSIYSGSRRGSIEKIKEENDDVFYTK